LILFFSGRASKQKHPSYSAAATTTDKTMDRIQQLMRQMPGGGMGGPPSDSPTPDCAEKVHVSSLALLKMLKHGRAGVPMEVMGLMLGQFVDEYTINCVDVFAMPQSGTSVSVEAVDPVFQTKMLDMLQQTGRGEMVVGWYREFSCNCFYAFVLHVLTTHFYQTPIQASAAGFPAQTSTPNPPSRRSTPAP
jgi:proteasome lid subunit RPN8/RPN11